MTPKDSSARRPRHTATTRPRRRVIGFLVLLTCLCTAIAGCSSGQSSNDSGNDEATSTAKPDSGTAQKPDNGSDAKSDSNANAAPLSVAASWNETWSANYFSTNYYGSIANEWALLPLAYPEKTTDRTKMFELIPMLMKSYSVDKSNKLTIHLRPNAKFSDGTPVDAKAVYNTLILLAVNQDFVFENDVENVTTPDKTTVVIQFTPHTANVNVRGWLAGIRPLPMSVYGQFIVPGLDKAAFKFNELLAKGDRDKAQASSAYKLLHSQLQKLLKFEPKKFVGSGPFTIENVTTAQATLKKAPTFYAAAKVDVPAVTVTNSSTAANIFPLLFGQKIDWYAATQASSTVLEKWKNTDEAHTLTFPNDISEEILFNNKKKPFTERAVRQAIAHVVDRAKLVATEVGGTSVNTPTEYPNGLTDVLTDVWIPKATLEKMNPYEHDTEKATSLLKSAGLTKPGDQWLLPDGKPFTTEVIAPSSPSTAVVAAKEVAAQLTEFGIKATASSVEPSGYGQQLQKGNFALAWQTGVGTNLEPMCGIATGGLGEPTNYTFSGSNGAVTQGEPGIGFGPTFDVPGLGNVPVSQTITTQCQNTNAGPKMEKLAIIWANLVNQEMPYLTYASQAQVVHYSTAHYTNWPPEDSRYFEESGIYPTQALVWMIQEGYVSPK